MTRTGVFVASAIATASLLSFGVYAMKYDVESLEKRAHELRRDISLQEQTLSVLHADWSYLNHPDRLENLINRHLELELVPARRIGTLSDIPFRVVAQPAEGRNPLLRPILPTPPAQAVSDVEREGP